MLKKLKLSKKPLFQKRRWSCDFPPRKTRVAQKHRTISRQEKMAFSTPVGLTWHSLPPPRVLRTDGRTDVRTYGRTDGRSRDYYVTTKILGLIGYQISLAMELHWRALPAGSAITWNISVDEASRLTSVLIANLPKWKYTAVSNMSAFMRNGEAVLLVVRWFLNSLPLLRHLVAARCSMSQDLELQGSLGRKITC